MVKITLSKQAKSEVLRARCDEQLKLDVVKIASFLKLDESDIVRIAAHEYTKNFKIESPFAFNR